MRTPFSKAASDSSRERSLSSMRSTSSSSSSRAASKFTGFLRAMAAPAAGRRGSGTVAERARQGQSRRPRRPSAEDAPGEVLQAPAGVFQQLLAVGLGAVHAVQLVDADFAGAVRIQVDEAGSGLVLLLEGLVVGLVVVDQPCALAQAVHQAVAQVLVHLALQESRVMLHLHGERLADLVGLLVAA